MIENLEILKCTCGLSFGEFRFKILYPDGTISDEILLKDFMSNGVQTNEKGAIDSWKILQYSGFNDKNGKCLYDGDMVMFDYEDEEPDCEEIFCISFYEGSSEWRIDFMDHMNQGIHESHLLHEFLGTTMQQMACKRVGDLFNGIETIIE